MQPNNKIVPHGQRRRGRTKFFPPIVQWPLASFVVLVALKYGAQALVDCNFERYQNGCYSQANFECDIETNKCRCQALTPVLIDDHLCVKRAKPNESCKYTDQCEIERGFRCYAWPPTQASTTSGQAELLECGPTETRCKCLIDSSLEPDLDGSHKQLPQSHYEHDRQRTRKAQNTANSHQQQQHNLMASYNAHHKQHMQQQQHRRDHVDKFSDNLNPNHNQNSTTTSILSRIIWFFSILILLGLIALLIIIKYQSFGSVERPFHRGEDRLSIESELDEPPPYEVAIRMKD